MAALAKFISDHGGIAFSESTLKIQKEGEEAVYLPVEEVSSLALMKPKEGSSGTLQVETTDGKREWISFEADQLEEAIAFGRAFEAFRKSSRNASQPEPTEEIPPAPASGPSQWERDYDEKTRAYREATSRRRASPNRVWFILAALAALALLMAVAIKVIPGLGR